jgi:hypothetical protein
MASLTLNLSTNLPLDVLTAEIDNADLDSSALIANACTFLKGCAAGAFEYELDVYAASANKAAATGVITPTQANVSNGDTITIGGVIITAATSGNGTTSFTIGGNLAATCTNLAACLNANPTLSPHIAATATSTTVTLAARLEGSIGNLVVMSTSDATAFAFTQFANGAGGPQGAAVSKSNTTI